MIRVLLKLLFSAILLGLLLWRTPLDQILLHLRNLNALSLALAALLSFVAWWSSAVRLWSLLPEFRFADLARATFIALFYGTALPGQIAGDVVKAYRLGKQSMRTGHAEASTLIDRMLAIFALFCIGAVAAMSTTAAPAVLRLIFVAGAVAIALAGAIAASASFRHNLLERLLPTGTGRIRSFIRHFAIALHECLRKPARMASCFLIALLFHGMCVAIHMLLGHALSITLGWAEWTVVYASVSLVMLLPVSIAGIGLRESGYVGMLALFGVAPGAALSLSFTMLALALLGALAGGVVELRNQRFSATISPCNHIAK